MLLKISKHFNLSPDKLTVAQIKTYLYHCREHKGLSVSFINQTISALKILFVDVEKLPWDDGLSIKRPRRNNHLPVILSQQEVRRMIEVTANPKHKALIGLLYSSGIRRDELINLKLPEIDSERMVIRIANGKGNKSRDTLLSPIALDLLRAYLRSHLKPKSYVFESLQPGKPYSSSSISKVVKKAAKNAGVVKEVSPHSLRHAFATHLLEQGANIKQIQYLMGHQSLKSTMVYLHLATVSKVRVISPLDAVIVH